MTRGPGGPAAPRAVIFDLWDTLVDWPAGDWAALKGRFAQRLGIDRGRFDALWEETYWRRQTGPLRDAFAAMGAPADSLEDLADLRLGFTRAGLVPRPGALETLEELRRRRYRLGLISVCSEDVPAVWNETPFGAMFDAAVFSATCGLRKPDPEIYLLACGQLEVEPREAVFVGDGANDELAGAERVGMRAVLIHRPGEEPHWPEVRGWRGDRVTSIPELLELL